MSSGRSSRSSNFFSVNEGNRSSNFTSASGASYTSANRGRANYNSANRGRASNSGGFANNNNKSSNFASVNEGIANNRPVNGANRARANYNRGRPNVGRDNINSAYGNNGGRPNGARANINARANKNSAYNNNGGRPNRSNNRSVNGGPPYPNTPQGLRNRVYAIYQTQLRELIKKEYLKRNKQQADVNRIRSQPLINKRQNTTVRPKPNGPLFRSHFNTPRNSKNPRLIPPLLYGPSSVNLSKRSKYKKDKPLYGKISPIGKNTMKQLKKNNTIKQLRVRAA